MKKTTCMLMGALGGAAMTLYMNKASIEKSVKKAKRNGMEALNKVKAIFE